MKFGQIIKKIRFFTLVSFLLPLITINVCLLIYQFIGNHDTYAHYNWSEKKIIVTPNQHKIIQNNLKEWSFTNCPKYKVKQYLISFDDQILEDNAESELKNIKYYVKERVNVKNNRCVKNSPFVFFLLNKIKVLEKILLISKEKNKQGFAKVKNPYVYGEISISKSARYFPTIFIFKPFIILTAIFLIFYWKNNLNLFKEFEKDKILFKFSKTFFYFGLLSCIFLILHAAFLGLDIESKLFAKLRRLIIISFIIFELLAQIYLTINLFKFRENIKKYINPFVLKIKITFVTTIIIITLALFVVLAWGDLSAKYKNIFEWNFFSALLVYYLLSWLMWKTKKTKAHTPESV